MRGWPPRPGHLWFKSQPHANLEELVFSFLHVSPRDELQVVKLGAFTIEPSCWPWPPSPPLLLLDRAFPLLVYPQTQYVAKDGLALLIFPPLSHECSVGERIQGFMHARQALLLSHNPRALCSSSVCYDCFLNYLGLHPWLKTGSTLG